MSQEDVQHLGRVFEIFTERDLDWAAPSEFIDPEIICYATKQDALEAVRLRE